LFCLLYCVNCKSNKDTSPEDDQSIDERLDEIPQLSKGDKLYLSKLEDALQSDEGKLQFTNSWAVKLHPSQYVETDRIATKHGFENLGRIGNLDGYFHFKQKSRLKRSVAEVSKHLREESGVLWAEQQHLIDRRRKYVVPDEPTRAVRSVPSRWTSNMIRRTSSQPRGGDTRMLKLPTDPKFHDMWYLWNDGSTSTGWRHGDINVVPSWNEGITGKGVVVSVLDDGVDWRNQDLTPNYDQKASYDFNDMDPDPAPRDTDPDNCHGTRCAGEIAAVADNGFCGTGVAYNASIGGIRMLDGQATDILEGSALSFQSNYIDIYSNCWGPKDDGKTFGKPGALAQEALMKGAMDGRNGSGNIYVWATGNGGLTDDDCNCDGYTTSIYTISIGCISDHGTSTYYTELCSSTLAVTYNGGSHREKAENKIITTDLKGQCTDEFKGTSSSAPLASGMIALTLQANPKLSWRDVQHIIVHSAEVTSPIDDGWRINGGGLRYNHKFGFGKMNAGKMVNMARRWKNVSPQKQCAPLADNTPQEIPAGGTLSITITTAACENIPTKRVDKLEHVTVTISFQARRRGHVSIDLFSPMGTRSQLLSTRRYDDSDKGLHDWTFMTVHNWGENPKGVWTLNVTDNDPLLATQFGEQADTSRQAPDIEDVEEEVIAGEKKVKQLEAKRLKQPNLSLLDVPLPSHATKRSRINTYKVKKSELDEDRDFLQRKKFLDDMFQTKNGPFEPITSTAFNFDRDFQLMSNEQPTTKVRSPLTEMLDVTGSQRVQVSNGYESPFPPMVDSNNRPASGQVLSWSLMFYGTSSREGAGRG